jgi:hypothetical protein
VVSTLSGDTSQYIFGAGSLVPAIAIATANVIRDGVATVVVATPCGEFDEAMRRDACVRQDAGQYMPEPA